VLDLATLNLLANGTFRQLSLGAPYYANSTRVAVFGSYLRTSQDAHDSRDLQLAFTNASDHDFEMKVNPKPTAYVSFDVSAIASRSANFISLDLESANISVDGQNSVFDRPARLLISDFGEFALSFDAFDSPIIRSPVGLSLWCSSCAAVLGGQGNATYQDNTFPFAVRLNLENAEFFTIEVAAPLTPFRFGAVRVAFVAASVLALADGESIATETRITYWPFPREIRDLVIVVSGIFLTVPLERVVQWWLHRADKEIVQP